MGITRIVWVGYEYYPYPTHIIKKKKKKPKPFLLLLTLSLSLCLSALSLSLSKHLLQCHSLMVAMVVSLLVSSLPLLIAIGDVLVPFVLISSFTCIECYSLKEHLWWYAFKSSLTDIPLISVVRLDCTFSDIPLVSVLPNNIIICTFSDFMLLNCNLRFPGSLKESKFKAILILLLFFFI